VSILSESDTERYCTGFTDALEARLKAHNQKQCKHTSKFTPWRIGTAVAFAGRAFAKKRL